jgi:DNA-binding transcriptional MerR regulator
MGSSLLSLEEAAKLAGVSTRTIYNWEKKGLIERVSPDTQLYDRAEILRVEEAKKESLTLESRYALVNLRYRVKKLEQHVNLLMHIHDTQQLPLRPSAAVAESTLDTAKSFLRDPSAGDLQHVDTWADLLLRTDEATMDVMGDGSWDILYRLCIALQQRVRKEEGFDTKLDLQVLHAKLDQARKGLRTAATLHLMSRGEDPSDAHLRAYPHADPKRAVFDRLGEKQSSFRG